jgi:hypothetical protein
MTSGRSSETPHRTPEEVRTYERNVWDLTRNLIHPAFLYVVLQVVLWCGLERHPAYQGFALSFWDRTAIHAIQFLGAWGVFYGTMLRDMRFQTRVVTIVLWLAAVGAAVVWLLPVPEVPSVAHAQHWILFVELVAGFVGWVITLVTWFRAKAHHSARDAGGSHD